MSSVENIKKNMNEPFASEKLRVLSTPGFAGGMRIERYLTQQGKSPFDFDHYGNPIPWVSEEVKISDDMGKVVFTQANVRRPEFWSPLAIKVVAGKYFWGDQAKGQRESSVEQLIGRVSRYIARQALVQGYFDQDTSTAPWRSWIWNISSCVDLIFCFVALTNIQVCNNLNERLILEIGESKLLTIAYDLHVLCFQVGRHFRTI
jgi:hypothetical protein